MSVLPVISDEEQSPSNIQGNPSNIKIVMGRIGESAAKPLYNATIGELIRGGLPFADTVYGWIYSKMKGMKFHNSQNGYIDSNTSAIDIVPSVNFEDIHINTIVDNEEEIANIQVPIKAPSFLGKIKNTFTRKVTPYNGGKIRKTRKTNKHNYKKTKMNKNNKHNHKKSKKSKRNRFK